MYVDSGMLDLSTFKPYGVNFDSEEEQKKAVLRSKLNESNSFMYKAKIKYLEK